MNHFFLAVCSGVFSSSSAAVLAYFWRIIFKEYEGYLSEMGAVIGKLFSDCTEAKKKVRAKKH